jgi:5-methylcytosine-specific restriction endonuclease McrA
MPNAARRHGAPRHERENTQPSRRTDYRGWYNTPAWKRLRDWVVMRDKGLCQECLRYGILTPLLLHAPQGSPQTAHVDHIRAHNGDWALFSNEANLWTLCPTCHSKKTAKEQQDVGPSEAYQRP